MAINRQTGNFEKNDRLEFKVALGLFPLRDQDLGHSNSPKKRYHLHTPAVELIWSLPIVHQTIFEAIFGSFLAFDFIKNSIALEPYPRRCVAETDEIKNSHSNEKTGFN